MRGRKGTGMDEMDRRMDGMDAEALLVRCRALERLERAGGVVEAGELVDLDAATAGALLLAGRVVCVSRETEAGTVGDRPERRGRGEA